MDHVTRTKPKVGTRREAQRLGVITYSTDTVCPQQRETFFPLILNEERAGHIRSLALYRPHGASMADGRSSTPRATDDTMPRRTPC
jgi:hypothetical protein